MKKPQGLIYWLRWIDRLKKWLNCKPLELDLPGWHEVLDVPYQDLLDLADHFNVEMEPEDHTHRKSVMVELSKQDTIVFFSPERKFTYLPIQS